MSHPKNSIGPVRPKRPIGPIQPKSIAPSPQPNKDLQSIRNVFGQQFQPAPAFKDLQSQGIFGAVRIKGQNDVFTIGSGGRKETADSFRQRFGTSNQQGIVEEVTSEQARQLGINVPFLKPAIPNPKIPNIDLQGSGGVQPTLPPGNRDLTNDIRGATGGDASGFQSIIDQINTTITAGGDREKTISEEFDERKKAAEDSAAAEKELVESRFQTEIEKEEKAGGRRLTAEQESRRGFATNTALVRQVEDQNRKRVRELTVQRDELLAVGKMSEAERIDSLIVDEQEAISKVRQEFLGNLFSSASLAISGRQLELQEGAASRNERGFETPAQQRQAQIEDLQKTALLDLQSEFPDIAGITDATDFREALALLGPRLSEDRKFELAQRQADLDLARAQTANANRPADPKPPSQAQFETAGFAQRIVQANSIFDTLEGTIGQMGTFARAFQAGLPQGLRNSEFQQQDQAERNFVNAILREESGAAIGAEEFKSAEKQYFPRAGDSPALLAQKKSNRQLVQSSLIAASGHAFDQIDLTGTRGGLTVDVQGIQMVIGTTITNEDGEQGRIEADGTITIL